MSIVDLPDWGEVRLFVGSRPLSASERADCQRIIDGFLRAWAVQHGATAGMEPLVAAAEVVANQVLVMGYAAMRPLEGKPQETKPYLMTGSDFDPLLDSLLRYASTQLPPLSFVSDDAVVLDAEIVPFMSAIVPLARSGRFDRDCLVITGGPISRWKAFGAMHAIGTDDEYYELIKEGLAQRQILIPN